MPKPAPKKGLPVAEAGSDTGRGDATLRNKLLLALSPEDLNALRPLLEVCELTRGETLDLPTNPTRYAIFPESGFVSVIVPVGELWSEVSLVGREGMLGVPMVLGADVAPYRAVVRQAGTAKRATVDAFRAIARERPAIGRTMLRFAQAEVVQLVHTSFANGRMSVAQRLARWLLMAHDRIDGDQLRISHETLATALAVRRAGVTVALHELEGRHALKARRTSLTVTSREILQEIAGPAYGPAENAYEQLMGRPIREPGS